MALFRKKKSKDKHELNLTPAPPNPALQHYLNEIGKYPLLTAEEENKMAKKFYETKDPKWAKILAQSNLRFVVKIATQYTLFGAKLIDLIQEGNIGLLQAIKKFNPYKELRLITYAVWWIRGYIQDYLIRQHSLVRLGTTAKQRKLFYLLKKQQNQIPNPLAPAQAESSSLLLPEGFKKQEVLEMKQRVVSKDLSLDAQIQGHQSTQKLLDALSPLRLNEKGIDEQLNELQEAKLLKKAIKNLKPKLSQKELYILVHRLLPKEKTKSLQEIGEHFLVTKEAIRQAETRLIQKIKKIMQKTLEK